MTAEVGSLPKSAEERTKEISKPNWPGWKSRMILEFLLPSASQETPDLEKKRMEWREKGTMLMRKKTPHLIFQLHQLRCCFRYYDCYFDLWLDSKLKRRHEPDPVLQTAFGALSYECGRSPH